MVICLAGVRNLNQLQTIPEVKWQEINKVFHCLKIFTFHESSTTKYTVDQLLPQNTPQRMTFKGKHDKQVTIAEYFKKVHLCELQELPLVQTLGKSMPFSVGALLSSEQAVSFSLNGHSERVHRK